MLKGKAAIVTGSTSGIGLAIAHALAKEGCNIMLNGFADDATVAQVKAQIAAFGVRVEFSGADVGKIDQVENMVDATVRAFGSCDIVVNNAGIQHLSKIEDFPLEKWDAVMSTNLFSVFYATRKVLPIMRHKGWGRIINVSSAHGLIDSANKIAYVAAKHGVVGMTKVTAIETAGSGITCNAVCPGCISSGHDEPCCTRPEELPQDLSSPQASDAEKQSLKRYTKPEEIGALAVFLCSDAAAQISGACYTLDGRCSST